MSRCQPGYICSKKPLSEVKAIEAYKELIMKTNIYKYPEDFLKASGNTVGCSVFRLKSCCKS